MGGESRGDPSAGPSTISSVGRPRGRLKSHDGGFIHRAGWQQHDAIDTFMADKGGKESNATPRTDPSVELSWAHEMRIEIMQRQQGLQPQLEMVSPRLKRNSREKGDWASPAATPRRTPRAQPPADDMARCLEGFHLHRRYTSETPAVSPRRNVSPRFSFESPRMTPLREARLRRRSAEDVHEMPAWR